MEIPVNYAQANLRFTGTAVPTGAELTLGLNIELYSGSASDAAMDVAVAAANIMTAQIVPTVAITSVLVKFGPNSTGESGEYTANIPGTGSGAAVSPNTAILIGKQTGFGGRTGRGRCYQPGIREALVDDSGLIDSGSTSSLQTAWDDFRTDLIAAALIPTLLHGPDSPISVPMPITSFVVSNKVATQRRRLRR